MYTSDYPILHVTVDIVVLTILDGELCALAVRRGEPPYQGRWALPGGFVRIDEDLDAAARRELDEETAVGGARCVSSSSRRTAPRAATAAPHGQRRLAGRAAACRRAACRVGRGARRRGSRPTGCSGEAGGLRPPQILGDGVERARAKLEYTNIAAAFLAEEFTIAELREVYEVVWGHPLDAGNFHRKVTDRGVRRADRATPVRWARPAGRAVPGRDRGGAEPAADPPLAGVAPVARALRHPRRPPAGRACRDHSSRRP